MISGFGELGANGQFQLPSTERHSLDSEVCAKHYVSGKYS